MEIGADRILRASGLSQVPLGQRGVFTFTVRDGGVAEDVTSVRFLLRNHLGATIYDATRTVADVAAVASDGGAVAITDLAGDGRYQVAYTPPNNGTYVPTADSHRFTLQVVITDEGGAADTGEIPFFIVPADITISDRASIIDKVRRRASIMEEIFITLTAGEEAVDLGKGGVFELPLVTKNGTVLSRGTHYTWNTYGSYLTLVSPATDGDEMFVQVQRIFSNEYLKDIIEEAESVVVYPALQGTYDLDDLVTSPTVEALIAAYTAGRLRQDKTKGATLDDPVYRSGMELIKMVQDTVKAVAAGSVGLSAVDGTEMATRAGAFVGAFIHPDGVINGRLAAVDRAQRWLGRLEHYWPEAAPDHVMDLRQLTADT